MRFDVLCLCACVCVYKTALTHLFAGPETVKEERSCILADVEDDGDHDPKSLSVHRMPPAVRLTELQSGLLQK